MLKVRNKSIQTVILRDDKGASAQVPPGESDLDPSFRKAADAHPWVEMPGKHTEETIGKVQEPPKPKRTDEAPDSENKVTRNG